MSFVVMLAAAALSTHARLIDFEPNVAFPAQGQEATLTYTGVKPGFPFDEVIPSWNVENGDNAKITVQVRAHGVGFDTKWYSYGQWSLDSDKSPRESIRGQVD